MAGQVGSVEQISGLVFAIDKSGSKRALNEKDALFLGEIIKPQDDASAMIQMSSGKQISINSADTLVLDQSVSINEKFTNEANVNPTDLQQTILSGADLSILEETAAGGANAAGGDLGGSSLGSVAFLDGGHESNVNSNYNGLEVINTNNVPNLDLDLGGAYTSSSVANQADNAVARSPLVKSIYFLENTNLIQDGYDRKSILSVRDGKIFISGNSKIGDKITTNFEDSAESKEYIVTKGILQKGYIEDPKALSAVQTNYLDDGYLNKNELLRDGDASKTSIRMTFDSAVAGDKLGYKLSDGEVHSVTLTQTDINRGYVDVSVDVPSHGSNLQVQASILQQDRFNDENAAQNSVKIDTKVGKFTITAVDNANGDDTITWQEIAEGMKQRPGQKYPNITYINAKKDSDVEIGDNFIHEVNTKRQSSGEIQFGIDQENITGEFGLHGKERSNGDDIENGEHYKINHFVVDKAGNVGEMVENKYDVHPDGRYNVIVDKMSNGKVYGHIEHYKDSDFPLGGVGIKFNNIQDKPCITNEKGEFEFSTDTHAPKTGYHVSITHPDGLVTRNYANLNKVEGSVGDDTMRYNKGIDYDFKDGNDTIEFDQYNSKNFDGFHGKVKNVENISLRDTKINLDIKDILDNGQDRIRISGYGKSSVKLSGFDKVEDTSNIENVRENTSYFTNADRTVILEVNNNVTVEM
ncbi:MAG: retention module-containing protein [Campylobacter sp.]